MPKFTLIIHGELVRQGLESFDEEIPKVGRQRIYLRMLRIRTRMAANAPKPRRPITWDSEKQRKFVLAKLRREGNLPYQRTGKTQRGWILTSMSDGYRLANEEPAAFFVYGDLFKRKSQSRIHEGTWPLTKVVTFEELDQLPDEISADIEAAKKRSGL
jgi:hypothetical protein